MLGVGVSLRHLRGTTAAAAPDAYAVAGFSPDLVFDFDDGYYRIGGSESTFDASITFARSSNATMVDSDGLLKWAPHNLLSRSQEFNVAPWVKGGSTSVSDGAEFSTVTLAAGTGPHWVYHGGPSGQVRQGIEAKAGTISWISISSTNPNSDGAYFDLSSGTVGTVKGSDTATITDLGDGWYYCEVVFALDEEFLTVTFANADDAGSDWTASSGETLYIRNARTIRKGLGGMVDNPDRGDSYVPTTSAARYLPRRGHHVYNGTSWVNEGLLHESEQRVNLLTYSSEFDNASWVKSTGVTVTANTDVAPDGTTSADTVTSGGNQITQGVSCVQNTVYTDSLFFKKTTEAAYTPALYLIFTGGTAALYAAVINTNTGVHTVVTASGFTAPSAVSVSDAGAYWRLSVSGNSGNNTTVDLRMYPNFNPVFAGVGPGSQVIWGAQLEAGSTPSSYIPTSGNTVIRAADNAGSDNLTYDSSAMWFTLSGLQTFADEGVAGQEVLFDWRADANNRITVTIDTDGAETGEITLTVVSGGTTWSVAQDYLSPGINVPFKVAWRVTDTEINVAAGGTSATAVATTSIPDLSSASAAFGGNGVYSLFRQGVGDLGDVGITEASE